LRPGGLSKWLEPLTEDGQVRVRGNDEGFAIEY
jgi:hypothetical protein